MSRSERLTLALLLLAAVALRVVRLDQPIVENYVGRQVPTAMVARNLERGGEFLRPQLDTGPFPNYFVVEPPLFQAAVVGLRSATGLALEPSGRLVSALGIALAAWGLFGLVRRREGPTTGRLAVAVFIALPITIRYGRAFQPDALMLGSVLAGGNLIDRGGPFARAVGLVTLAVGLALKVTSAFVLIPLATLAPPGRRLRTALGLGLALVPVALWYLHASSLLATAAGSRATADAGRAWLEALGPLALLDRENAARLARFLLVRAFTPLALPLVLLGVFRVAGDSDAQPRHSGGERELGPESAEVPVPFPRSVERLRRSGGERGLAPESAEVPVPFPWWRRGPGFPWRENPANQNLEAPGPSDRFWLRWTLAAVAMLLVIAGKLHHEYYLLALAPPVAVGMARGLLALRDRLGVPAAALGAIALGGLAGLGVRSTWRTPDDWRALEPAARLVRAVVPPDALLVAPEALLYAADRKGCRLETGRAAARAAGEWGAAIEPDDPLALTNLYRQRGARYFADLTDPPPDPARRLLHDAVRARYPVRYDGAGVLIAALTETESRKSSDEPQGHRGDRARLRPVEGGGPQDRRPDGL